MWKSSWVAINADLLSYIRQYLEVSAWKKAPLNKQWVAGLEAAGVEEGKNSITAFAGVSIFSG